MKRLSSLALAIAVLTLVAAGLSVASAAFAQTASPEQLWQRGAQCYERRDYRDAFALLLAAARAGHPRAQALLAIMYQEGDGMPENDREAAHWFALAAAQGHRAAQFELGAMYEEGEGGLPKDVSKAAELYAQSARQGFAQAQFALGLSYEFGDGVPRNRATAIYWLNQAAAHGDGRAHWVADWLRNPSTPYLQNSAQLGAYIGSKLQQYFVHGGSRTSAPCGTPVSCSQMMGVRFGQVKTNGGGGEIGR
jgi:TPR repeat protein